MKSDFFNNYIFLHTFQYSGEHHQIFFLFSDFLAEILKVNKKLAKNIA